MISVCGLKGAPGASHLALLLAACWPRECVLVEADPAGGQWALLLEGPQGQALPAVPSIAGLAVDAAQRIPTADRVWANALQTSAGPAVVCGLPQAEPMTTLMREYGRHLAAMLAASPDVVVDAGRLTPDTGALALLAASTVVVVVLPDRHDALYRLSDLLPGLTSVMSVHAGVRSAVVPVVVAGARRGEHAAREVDELLAQQHIPAHRAHALPVDEKAARAVRGGVGRAGRSPLVRSARTLAELLAVVQRDIHQQRARAAAAPAPRAGIANVGSDRGVRRDRWPSAGVTR